MAHRFPPSTPASRSVTIAIVVKHRASSRARRASGIVVMPTMSQPACWCITDSARDEKRGPFMTTSVPSVTTSSPRQPGRVDRYRRPLRAVGLGEADMDHRALGLVERVLTAPGAIDDLVGHDDRAWTRSGLSDPTAHGREDLPDTDGAQRPEVGPVVDPVWREPVPLAVPSHERDNRPSTSPMTRGSLGSPNGVLTSTVS